MTQVSALGSALALEFLLGSQEQAQLLLLSPSDQKLVFPVLAENQLWPAAFWVLRCHPQMRNKGCVSLVSLVLFEE